MNITPLRYLQNRSPHPPKTPQLAIPFSFTCIIIIIIILLHDCLFGLVVRVSGYRYRGPGFDPRRCQIFWVVVGLERGPLSLVRSIEELLEWKCSGSRSRKQRLTAVGTRCADHVTPLYPQKLALTSPTGGARSVDIVRVRTKARESLGVITVRSSRASGHCAARDHASAQHPVTGCTLPRAQCRLH